MSYQVLARQWRPRNFKDVVGQEPVLQALTNALGNNRLHHAYLFTGTRGVGKTTIARILAACLNCEQGVCAEPCGQCAACIAINEGRFVDLIEVDAASRTKVEDTRELLDNVQYAPTVGRFKVYLIDEVHMLSTHSFNALLKTLEEPPPHIKFLLATTDPQKLPATILSRCLQFHLKAITAERIASYLQQQLKQESITCDEAALHLLGHAAAGSLRDALSLTDQAIAFGAGCLSVSNVRCMLGMIDQSPFYDMIEALAQSNAEAVFAVLQSLTEQAPDYSVALEAILTLLHRIAIAQVLPGRVGSYESTGIRECELKKIQHMARTIPAEDIQLFYQLALNARRDLPLSPDPRDGFEMALLRMLAFKPAGIPALPTRPLSNDDSCQKADVTQYAVKVTPEKAISEKERQITRVKPDPQNWSSSFDQWEFDGILSNIASHCVLDRVESNTLHFIMDENYALLFKNHYTARIQAHLCECLGEKINITITVGKVCTETPAAMENRKRMERKQHACGIMRNDRNIKLLEAAFDATLDEPTALEAPFIENRG